MFNRDNWQEIFHSIKNNKLRTFLTGFSVAWGIFILVLLLASVNGMKNGFTGQFGNDAANSINMYARATTEPYGGFEAGRRIQFTNNDIVYIRGNFADSYEHISPIFNKQVTARFKRETGSYSVIGVNEEYQHIEIVDIDKGRQLNTADVRSKSKVMVVGRLVAKDLFDEENPIGQFLEINGITYNVVGVFSDDDDDRSERNIYAPYTTLQRIYGNTDNISSIALTYNPQFSLAQALTFSDQLEVLFKRKYKVSPDDQSAIGVRNRAQGFSDVNSFTGLLSMMSIGVGFLILIAGIVGIGNILVFIIKERTKEIGIRKALGARPNQILSLVLYESIVITTISGFVGLLFAMGILAIVAPLIDTPAFSNPSVDVSTVVIATLVLIISGVVAGWVPARKASKVRPIVALNSD
ncbi:ABC transporter permease [Cellulophaga baltica]|uniref:ABC transporter permease n=1 Tax=Cellulophaga baltica TaxID=76594 RepID=UPI0021492B20|nr:ABC transporter permease [Cellulophaga baltica]MCR1023695.1 ABC transporter permease [Cellulophaga baltica]